MKYFLLLMCCSAILGGCFGKKNQDSADTLEHKAIEFNTNDNLDQAFQDLEAVRE